jgi:hypothetical protein
MAIYNDGSIFFYCVFSQDVPILQRVQYGSGATSLKYPRLETTFNLLFPMSPQYLQAFIYTLKSFLKLFKHFIFFHFIPNYLLNQNKCLLNRKTKLKHFVHCFYRQTHIFTRSKYKQLWCDNSAHICTPWHTLLHPCRCIGLALIAV